MTAQLGRMSAFTMWLLASIFYAYQYIIRVLPNLIMPDVIEKFQIDASIFGQFSGVYYIGYAAMHIPVGILLDRIGPRLIMPLLIILTALGLLPLIYADVWVYPVIGRALIGMGSTGAILGVFKIVRMVYDESKFTRMLGLSVTIGLIGAIWGGQPVNYAITLFGWEQVVMALVIAGIGLAALTYASIPAHTPEPTNIVELRKDIWSVLSNPMVVSICLLGGLMVGPLEGFADVWGTEYLKTVYSYSDDWGSTLPSFIFFGMCFGASFLTYLADKTRSYYGMTILSAFGMAIGFILLLLGLLDRTTMMVVFTIVGIFSAYQILVIYLASTYVQEKVVGLTTACANMIIMIFGYLFHSSIGGLMSFFWTGTIENGTPFYGPFAYTSALSIIPISLLVAAVGFSFLSLRTKHTKALAP